MQITFNQAEIERALQKHIRSMIKLEDGVQISMTFAATRGEEGLKATIELSEPNDEPAPVAVVEQKVAEPVTRKPKVVPEKVETTPVAEAAQKPVVESEPEVATDVKEPPFEADPGDPEPPAEPVADSVEAEQKKPAGGFPGFAKDKKEPPVSDADIEEQTPEELAKTEAAAKQTAASTKPSLFSGLPRPSNK